MEFKHYSVTGTIEGLEVKLLGTLVDYNVFEGVGEFVNGKLIEPKYTVVNRSQIDGIIKAEKGSKKSLEFINVLADKIQEMLDKEINKDLCL